MHHAVVVAIITGVATVTVAFLNLLTALRDKGDKRKNNSSSTTPQEVNEQLHSLERRMDRMERRVGRLETEHVLQDWNGYEEVNQKMLN